jgi:hypothetical protein
VGVHGWDWLWIVIAVFLDLGNYAGVGAQRNQMPGRSTPA